MNPAVQHLVQKGKRSLTAARALLERGDGDFAVSRAYYAMFYLAEAALLSKGFAFSKHSAVISAFGRELVKSGELPASLHDSLRKGFDERNIGDYDAVSVVPAAEARAMLQLAEAFVAAVDSYLCSRPLHLGVLISGGGRSLQNFVDLIARGELNANISVVVSSLAKVKGVDRAREAGLPVEIIRVKDHPDIDEFSGLIVSALESRKVDLVIMAGWTALWKIPDHWLGRVMNIHPALLPKYGGKGYFGHHVHESVLAAGEKESGCTVHFANNEYDAGPIILQRKVPVLPADDADALAARVFEQECIAYPEAIRLYAAGRVRLDGNRVIET